MDYADSTSSFSFVSTNTQVLEVMITIEEDTNGRGAQPGPVPGSVPERTTGHALFGDHPS